MKTNYITGIPIPSIMTLPTKENGNIRWINLSQVVQVFYHPDDNTMYIEFSNENHENLRGDDARAVYQEMVNLATRFESIRL